MEIKKLNYRKSLKRSGFISNVVKLLAGNMAAQAIGLITAPIIARLYTPEDFGSMTLVTSIIGILSVFSCLRYENAIVLPKDNKDGLNLLVLCLIISCLFAFFLLFFVWLLRNIQGIFPGISALGNLLWFVPLGVFILGICKSFVYWQTRIKNFSILSINRVFIQVSVASSKIASGFWIGSSAGWLITGNIIGQLTGIIILGYALLRYYLNDMRKTIRKPDMLRVAQEFRDFPKYKIWTGFLKSVAQNLPVFWLAYFFSNEVVGFFGLANSLLKKPINLISQSISRVFLQKAAETEARSQDHRKNLTKATLGLAFIGIIPFGILMIGGREIFTFLFGNEWSEAGLYAQLLAPWLFTGFIKSPSTQFLLVKRKLRFGLYFNIVNIIFISLAIVIGMLLCPEPWGALLLFSAIGVLANLYLIRFAFCLLPKEDY
jgi:O-antigen/teichoic acid export membrane protein